MTIASQNDERNSSTAIPLPRLPQVEHPKLRTIHEWSRFRIRGGTPARRRNDKWPSRIIAAAGAGRSHMGLLASIVAYLIVVAAIVIGFLMSADALLHHSHQLAANSRPEIVTAAKTNSLKTKKAVQPSRNAAEQRTIPRRSTATEYRRKAGLSNSRAREPRNRTVHEARRGYWPLYRQPAPAPRALGYAEEPRFNSDPWR